MTGRGGGGKGAVAGTSARGTAVLGEKSTRTGCRGDSSTCTSGGIKGGSSSSSKVVEIGLGVTSGAKPGAGATGDGLGSTEEGSSFFTGVEGEGAGEAS